MPFLKDSWINRVETFQLLYFSICVYLFLVIFILYTGFLKNSVSSLKIFFSIYGYKWHICKHREFNFLYTFMELLIHEKYYPFPLLYSLARVLYHDISSFTKKLPIDCVVFSAKQSHSFSFRFLLFYEKIPPFALILSMGR